jgi:transcriptional regulator with XRE-family HTH domain
VRVHCRLRELREKLPARPDGSRMALSDMAKLSGVSAGVLSQIERGVMLPPDRQIPAIENAYGAALEDWFGDDLYARRVMAVLLPDEDE